MADKYNELSAGLDYDNRTGNYKATEAAASDYGDDAWQDDNGQWWVDGNAVAESLSDARGDEDEQ